jgi:hypothetical protein
VLGSEVGPFQASSDNVILSALYPERGKVLTRLYEYQGRHGQATVAAVRGKLRVEAVDLLGRDARAIASPITFKPWQIQTMQIDPAR